MTVCDDDRVSRRVTPWSQHVLIYALFFLMGAELFLVSPLLAVIAADLHVSDATAAWTVSGYVLGYAISSPVLAAITDRAHRRTVILVGTAIFAVGDLACAVAPSSIFLAFTHALSGIGGGLAAPAAWAYLGETAAEPQRGRAIAAGAAVYAAGQIVGVPLGSILADGAGWRAAFLVIAAALCLVAILIALRLREPEDWVRARYAPKEALRRSLRLWTRPLFAATLAATALTQAARIGTYSYLGVLFTHRYGFTLIDLGSLGSAVGAGSLCGSLAAGFLVDAAHRRGYSVLFLLAGWGAVLAAAIPVALVAPDLLLSLTAVLIWCAAGAACYSTTQAFLSQNFGRKRAAAISWNNSAMNAGIALGTALLGTIPLASGEFPIAATALALAGIGAALTARSQERRASARGLPAKRNETEGSPVPRVPESRRAESDQVDVCSRNPKH